MIFISDRIELLKFIKKGGLCAEIGVYKGWYSNHIIQVCEPKKHYMIDGWETIEHLPADINGELKDHLDKKYWVEVRKQVEADFAKDKQVKIICGDSVKELSKLKNKTFDFIYIDGNHTYKGCLADLEAASSKVAVNGFLGGHDFCQVFPGVIAAVLQFVEAHKEFEFHAVTTDRFASFLLLKKDVASSENYRILKALKALGFTSGQ